MTKREWDYFKLSSTTIKLNTLFRRKFTCQGIIITNVFFTLAIVVTLLAFGLFTWAIVIGSVAGAGYLLLDSYMQHVNKQIIDNMSILDHLQNVRLFEGTEGSTVCKKN